MTTKIIVEANHGWPVEVKEHYYKEDNLEIVIVEENTIHEFHIWDGKNLIIHEIQPDEVPPFIYQPKIGE